MDLGLKGPKASHQVCYDGRQANAVLRGIERLDQKRKLRGFYT